jgi:prepilin-type N-terminal cleavage/methylation domain-containing protein
MEIRRRALNRRGVTLTELMVAVMVLSVAIVGSFASFKYIVRSLHVSRTRTLASNLAQEKIEILKNQGYYGLRVTTATATIPNMTALYDTSYYPPETITISNISFRRYTMVSLALIDSNVITTTAQTYPDTGIKQMTVTIAWNDGGVEKNWSLNNLLYNPRVKALNSSFSGTVTKAAGGAALQGAHVEVEGFPDWNATTDSLGKFAIPVTSGTYSLRCSSGGYFDGIRASQIASQNANTVVDFTMTAIGTGTISGYAYLNPTLVISQIVVSSVQVGGNPAQWIELYNPTTAQINLASCSPTPCTQASPLIQVNARPRVGGGASDCVNIPLVYVSTYVPAYSYYLIANHPTFGLDNVTHTANAYYQTPLNPGLCVSIDDANDRIMNVGRGGGVWLADADGTTFDSVGWTGPAGPPPYYEGDYINLGSNGMEENRQLVRVSSPTAKVAVGSDLELYGRAYDSRSNASDFWYDFGGQHGYDMALGPHVPYATSAGRKLPISGQPAVGAYVSSSDPYSGSTQTYAAYFSSASGSLGMLYAPFSLVGVSTTPPPASCAGSCWTVTVASGTYFQQVSTIAVTQNFTTWIPSTNTVMGSTASIPSVLLASSSLNGFVAGRVSDANNASISLIQVSINGTIKWTGTNGTYFTSASSGAATVVANINNANNSYQQQVATPDVETGQIVSQDFTLSQGGSLRGYVRAGVTPLPNILFTATVGGTEYGEGSSDNTGYFTIRNLSTGTYIVAATLDTGVGCSPAWKSVTVSAGQSVFSDTFTLTNAFGTIIGTVTYNGSAVTTGALIVASTQAISVPPTTVNGSSAAATNPTYAISSISDGTYTLPVRAGTYNIFVAYPSIGGTGAVSIVSKTYSGVVVSASGTTSRDLTLP